MTCIDAYFEMIRDMQFPRDERNAFSQLDHQIQYNVGMEAAMEMLRENICDKYDVPKKYKVYIAALAEYIFHQCGAEPPVWVYEEQFYLPEPIYAEGVEALCQRFGKDNLKQIISEAAIPEFKKRNFMLSDVLSAV